MQSIFLYFSPLGNLLSQKSLHMHWLNKLIYIARVSTLFLKNSLIIRNYKIGPHKINLLQYPSFYFIFFPGITISPTYKNSVLWIHHKLNQFITFPLRYSKATIILVYKNLSPITIVRAIKLWRIPPFNFWPITRPKLHYNLPP